MFRFLELTYLQNIFRASVNRVLVITYSVCDSPNAIHMFFGDNIFGGELHAACG